MSDSLKKPAIFLTLLYSFAWGPMLFMRGAYWDGWVFFSQFTNKDYAWVYFVFAPPRNYFHYYTFRFLDLFPDPTLAARCIVFVSWLLSGLLLLRILRRFLSWDTRTATLCVAYYLLFPVFIVRFEFIHVYYSAITFFFTLAAYLFLDSAPRSWIWTILREISAVALFTLAFLFNSFVFFFFGFLGVHLYLFSQKYPGLSLYEVTLKWVKRFFYLLLFPFVFMGIKMVFFAPYGPSVGYNKILLLHPSFSVLTRMIEGFWEGFWSGFLWPFAAALQFLERKYFALALILAAAIVLYIFRRYPISRDDTSAPAHTANEPFYVRFWQHHPAVSMIVGGLFFLFLGLFPYVVVGKSPHIYGYGFGLRHSLLMPLGSALMLFGLVSLIVREQMQFAAHVALLSLSIAFLWFNFFLLDTDWYKQQAIIAKLPEIVREIPPPATFVFMDGTTGYNWLNRMGSRQDFTGYLQLVSGKRDYYGVNAYDYAHNPQPEELAVTSTIHLRIVSERNWGEPKVTEWLYLKYIELRFGEERLREEASRILQIALINEAPVPETKTLE